MTIKLQDDAGVIANATAGQITQIKTDLGITSDIAAAVAGRVSIVNAGTNITVTGTSTSPVVNAVLDYADLTDATTAELPTVNLPLSDALEGKVDVLGVGDPITATGSLNHTDHANRQVPITGAGGYTLSINLDSTGNWLSDDCLELVNSTNSIVYVSGGTATLRVASGYKNFIYPNEVFYALRTDADTWASVTPNLIVDAPASGNYLISGGGVAFTSGLNVTASTATYVIQGEQYTSAQTNLTATTADPTNPRIDVVVVDNLGVASLITGTAAASPVKPAVDPASQLELTFFIVAAAATSLTATIIDVYHENVEYTTSRSGTTFTLASTNNPRQGSVCVEGTNVTTGNYVRFAAPSDIDLNNTDNLVFYIRSKAVWPSTRTLSITVRNTAGTQLGAAVTLTNGSFGFNSAQTSTYQQIVIPVSLFTAGGLAVRSFQFTCVGTDTNLGMYLDDFTLQGGLAAVIDSSRMKWRGTYSATALYNVNDVVLSVGTQYVAIAQGSANTPASSPTFWQASSGTVANPTEAIIIACSDEATALTTGTAKMTFRMPYAFTLSDVRASVTTAPTGGTLLTVDVNETGTTILSTKLTFDASEKTTTTATTPRVISDTSLANDAEITVDIDAVGSTIAGAGLKVYLIGART